MKKNDKAKQEVLEKIQRIPVIEVVCQQMNISRMTLSRWRKEDKKFSEQIDKAISEGQLLINDLAESGLIGHIKDRNLPAIMAWLRVHHPKYGNKIEISGNINNNEDEPLSPEQAKIARAALRMAKFDENHGNKK